MADIAAYYTESDPGDWETPDSGQLASKKKRIHYPQAASEFEIQAYLMFELRSLGYDVRGEVRCGVGRLDLVVFGDDRLAIRIIEVKKHRRKTTKNAQHKFGHKEFYANRAQIKRYTSLEIPLDVVATMKNAKAYIASIRAGGFSDRNQRLW